MSYLYDSSAFCRQSDHECQGRMERSYRYCQAAEGEVLAYEVAACEEISGKKARIKCLDGALARFSRRLNRCLL